MSELYLDCHDLDLALRSVAGAIERTPDELAGALRTYHETPGEDYMVAMPRAVLGVLGIDIDQVSLDYTRWFHGTRAFEPERFREIGLLPMPDALDWLWEQLYSLVADELSPSDWDDLRRSLESDSPRHNAELYRLRRGWRGGHGPFGELVRDVLLQPAATSSHDYLDTPETVEDIAAEVSGALGINLGERFTAATVPCIVKFRTTGRHKHAVETALLYLRQVLTDGQISGRVACCGYSGNGRRIPPEDILDVETHPSANSRSAHSGQKTCVWSSRSR